MEIIKIMEIIEKFELVNNHIDLFYDWMDSKKERTGKKGVKAEKIDDFDFDSLVIDDGLSQND